MSIADYAVIGDLHEVVPAISASCGGGGRSDSSTVAGALAPRRPRSSLGVAGTLFGRRALLLTRLVRSASRCSASTTCRSGVRNEAVVVLGQKKLLQRLGPGLIHALIFWGFLVLFPTIVMALIGAVARGDAAVARLAGLVRVPRRPLRRARPRRRHSAFWIRKVQRPERFKGSHLGEADLILGLIALIVLTLLLWHAALIATGLNEWPASLVSGLERDRAGLRRGQLGRGARADLRLGARPARRRLPRLPAALEASPHRDGGGQRLVRPHALARPARAARLHGRGRERDALRRRTRSPT